MFRNLLTRLFADGVSPHDPLGVEDGEVAIAALLIRVARADARYTPEERRRIEAILARRGGLTHDEAIERRVAAEMIEAEAPDTTSMTRIIKQRVALEDRMDVIAALWEVALTDGRPNLDEEVTVRFASGLLGLNDVDMENLRRAVGNQSGPG